MKTIIEFENMPEFITFVKDQTQDMSLNQMSKELGINRSTLKRWFEGTVVPSSESVKKVGEYLGITARIG